MANKSFTTLQCLRQIYKKWLRLNNTKLSRRGTVPFCFATNNRSTSSAECFMNKVRGSSAPVLWIVSTRWLLSFSLPYFQVGSSSIKGMPGMFGVDMLSVAPQWPLPESFAQKMDELGFRPGGNSPHAGEKGVWFFKRDDPEIVIPNNPNEPELDAQSRTRHVGTVLHVVLDDESHEILHQFIVFREYCRQTQEGFARYSALKTTLASMEGQSKMAYKIQKNKGLAELKIKAREWWNQKGLKLEDFTD